MSQWGQLDLPRDGNNGQLDSHAHVTTQYVFNFDRATGLEVGTTKALCAIDSVVPLPSVIHEIMLGLGRKFRVAIDWGKANDWEKVKLTQEEIRGLVFVNKFYANNPLSVVRCCRSDKQRPGT